MSCNAANQSAVSPGSVSVESVFGGKGSRILTGYIIFKRLSEEENMDYLDYTHPLPEMNLAIDEALLTFVDDGAAAPVLRFWESPSYFIVMGYSSPSQHDVHVAACQADGLAILRRCSGGGTVIQGPGCLNYALIDTSDDPLDLPSTTAT